MVMLLPSLHKAGNRVKALGIVRVSKERKSAVAQKSLLALVLVLFAVAMTVPDRLPQVRAPLKRWFAKLRRSGAKETTMKPSRR